MVIQKVGKVVDILVIFGGNKMYVSSPPLNKCDCNFTIKLTNAPQKYLETLTLFNQFFNPFSSDSKVHLFV